MSVKDELDNLGRRIAADAKKNALPNKKTGALDRSIKYETTFISNEKFQIVIDEKYYGTYLNSGTRRGIKGTHYMDRAIEKNIIKGTDDIINTIAGEILNSIKTNFK